MHQGNELVAIVKSGGDKMQGVIIQTINTLFLRVLQMSLTAGVVIVVVLLARLFIRRLPKSFAYTLWLVVAFRLMIPVTAGADISIFNVFKGESILAGISANTGSGITRTAIGANGPNDIDGEVIDDSFGQAVVLSIQGSTTNVASDTGGIASVINTGMDTNGYSVQIPPQNSCLVSVLAVIWLAGILTLVSYTVAMHVRVRRRVRYSIRLSGNVYECDAIRSPFVLGVFAPRIYLPFRLNETEQQCILAHERYHISRKDYLVKSFAYLLTVVYWFQPLVWAAYRLMCVDMEMSCDEKVVSGFSAGLRKEYSRLLLAFAVNRRQLSAGPLAFGEENTMKRIKNIMYYKKASRWKLTAGVAAILFTMAACATDASTDEAMPPMAGAPVKVNEMSESEILNLEDGRDYADITVHNNHTDVTVHNYHTEDSAQNISGAYSIEHREAQWAENSMFDMEMYSLDYADADRIVFHISSGLFVYDLNSQKIIDSIDLKALNCQAVQTGGECEVAVYQNDKNQLRAAIKPYPYSEEGSYIYDLENDELFAYDTSLLDSYKLFDGFASKYDTEVSETMRTWRAAGNVLPLDDGSYGALYWGPGPELANMSYEAGDQKWAVFQKEQATLPKLEKQDDSFYQSFSLYSGKEIGQCLLDYSAFYDSHDYDGIYALSTGLEYSDELRQEFAMRTDSLSGGQEVSHSEDEKEYLFEFICSDDSGGQEQKVYVNFKYLEGEGWRAEGLPTVF